MAQCNIGTEKYPDFGINSDCTEDKNRQGHRQLVSCFKRLTIDVVVQPYVTIDVFITSNVNAAGENCWDIG